MILKFYLGAFKQEEALIGTFFSGQCETLQAVGER